MKINVLYFASCRERLGVAFETIELPKGGSTVGEARTLLAQRGGAWLETMKGDQALLVAVNQSMAKNDTQLSENAELAFFPPVSGG